MLARGWCAKHYNRWKAHGSPELGGRRHQPLVCVVEGCDRPTRAHGWCACHWARWKKHGDVLADKPVRFFSRPASDVCSVEGCPKPRACRGLCHMHYMRWQTHGEPGEPGRRKAPPGQRRVVSSTGYVVVSDGSHYGIPEHRKLMAERLGRPLLRTETVHHRNGQRADNRLENLELRSHSHPSGQTIEDKLAWAREFIALYG